MKDKFLGRTLNTNTMMYEHTDGSGIPFPVEIKQFIQSAIEGGWNPRPEKGIELGIVATDDYRGTFALFSNHKRSWTMFIQEILLDPKAWEAVARTEGWEDDTDPTIAMLISLEGDRWKHKQLNFIKALQQGKDIESALSDLN